MKENVIICDDSRSCMIVQILSFVTPVAPVTLSLGWCKKKTLKTTPPERGTTLSLNSSDSAFSLATVLEQKMTSTLANGASLKLREKSQSLGLWMPALRFIHVQLPASVIPVAPATLSLGWCKQSAASASVLVAQLAFDSIQ